MNKLKIGNKNKFFNKSKKEAKEENKEPSKFIKISNLDEEERRDSFVATYHLLPSINLNRNFEEPISEQDAESSNSEIEDHPIDEFQEEMNVELKPVSNYREIKEEQIDHNSWDKQID